MTAYLDCNATTPMDPSVADVVLHYTREEFGNAGSRTHEFGARAKQAVQKARDQIAAVVGAGRDEVVFTSGATESNNLAILGLAAEAERSDRKHIVTTNIEHKAVLEPIEHLESLGFEVTIIPAGRDGAVTASDVVGAIRQDTILVSVMQINNETGMRQPIREISTSISKHPAYFHVDAAQGFGKEFEALLDSRIDLISISGHKIYGPKGIGALVTRRRGYKRAPLEPLMFGGGQERGLRPGTLPVALIAGLGEAAELASRDHKRRREACLAVRKTALSALEPIGVRINGREDLSAAHVLNVQVPGVSAEAAMVALKGLVAISNGSACTSHSYVPSHVLTGMGLSEEEIMSSIRISWSHQPLEVDWEELAARLSALQ